MKRYSSLLAVALLLCCVIEKTNGVYFQLAEGDKKCFLVEVPKDTLVLAKFKATAVTATPPESQGGKVGVRITVEDPYQGVKQRFVKIFKFLEKYYGILTLKAEV